MWGFLGTQKCLGGWGSEKSGLRFSKDSWKNDVSNLEEMEGTSFVTAKVKTCLLLPVHTNRTAVHLNQVRLPVFLQALPSISMHKILPLSPLTAELAAQGHVYPLTAGFGGQSFMMHVSTSPWGM